MSKKMETSKEIISFVSNITNGKMCVLPKGEYAVAEDCTQKRFYYQSNNDAGERDVAFLLRDMQDITLDFSGSTLVFQGRISPFVFENCKNVTLKNVIVDYDRPFFTEGVIVETGKDYYVLKIDREKFPYRVEEYSFIACAPTWECNLKSGINLFLEYDAIEKAPAYNSLLQICVTGGENAEIEENSPLPENILWVEDLGNGLVKFSGEVYADLKVGNVMVITHERRINNTVYAVNSENLHFENVRVIHSGAMGIVCQICKDIFISAFRCELTERSKGLVTLNCDALHFVNCSGIIEVQDSIMENMMDDGINIHGIYTTVAKVEKGKLLLDIHHFQQYGINVYCAGDEIAVMKKGTYDAFIPVKVLASKMLGEKQIEILTDSDLTGVEYGCIAVNDERMPSVRVCGCRTGRNRPRGFLITTPKKVVIENNYFNNSAFGLHFPGESTFWFESSGVRNVLIRGNHFDNCCYHYGEYPIVFMPVFGGECVGYYHKNIEISGNRFDIFGDGIVYAEHTENILVKNNIVVKSEKYQKRADTLRCEFRFCENAKEIT